MNDAWQPGDGYIKEIGGLAPRVVIRFKGTQEEQADGCRKFAALYQKALRVVGGRIEGFELIDNEPESSR